MSNRRKICVITGSRAEYGLLYWLMREIESSDDLELQIVATGMHMSPEFGLTYKQIESDGFIINAKVEMLLSSDTEIGIGKSMGVGMISFSDVLNDLQPDLLVVLGDRFEVFSAVSSAMVSRIPVAHLHGGEATEGLIDEPIRHSVTKMSHLHFTAAEEFRKRVIQLGESPDRVFNFGAIGIDNINKLKLLSRSEFEDSINFKLNKKNLLVTFHPVTLDNSSAEGQFQALLDSLDDLTDTNFIFTKSNADTDGRIINSMIDDYVVANKEKAVCFTSLGQLRYLSALQYMDAAVGNSSSGLIEAPSFKIATINIGDRQQGRIFADSVICCEPKKASISAALDKLYSDDFQLKLKGVDNPYGNGGVSEKIVEVLKSRNLDNIMKKEFYDLEVSV